MTTKNKITADDAIALLGDYAYRNKNKKSGSLLINRVAALMRFINDNRLNPTSVNIETNNNWSKPPRPKSAKLYCHLGGTTYKYQLWAVVR